MNVNRGAIYADPSDEGLVMTRADALRILNLTDDATAAQVRAAFKNCIRERLTGAAGCTIDALREARDILTNQPATTFYPCTACRGRGRVQIGMVPQACMVCGGTGEKHVG